MLRNIIQIDEEKCDGCGLCAQACAEGAIEIIDGKAKLVSEVYCDGLGACLGECPQGAITIEQREAKAFDQTAVDQFLAKNKSQTANQKPSTAHPHSHEQNHHGHANGHGPIHSPMHHGHGPVAHGHSCPGSALRMIHRQPASPQPTEQSPMQQVSCLGQWPVQLMLVPPHAPFLAGADLVICADCVPFAVPDFHTRYLAGKAILVGCPKLDDLEYYREKLHEIFQVAKPRSITVLKMEVPCCSGIAHAAIEGWQQTIPETPLEVHTIRIQGGIDIQQMGQPKLSHAQNA